MSYCVNCGVELAATEKSCPLCFVEVNNPKSPFDHDTPPLYPDVPLRGVLADRRDLIVPFLLFMLIPMAICLATDFLTSEKLGWSLYVVTVLLLLCVFVLPPLAMRQRRMVLCIVIDWFATGVFLYALDKMTPGSWFNPIAVPFLVGGGVIVIGSAVLFVYGGFLRLVRLAIVLFAVAATVLLADVLIQKYVESARPVGWSLLVLAPCLILGIIALVINRNKRLKEQVRQRFFV